MHERASDYTVLARRFRPQTFGEVVGQQHIAQALRNAIQNGRVAHAYLFTGARGVGKTSMARIVAKVLNCPNRSDGDPCNACEICEAIASGDDVDVLEIDGASNRGIDDVRTLRANVNVKSMRTSYKVYIIDEVHMLTNEAFNALLKTLEEPPPNVKFVFCTTEPNKVPETILSRCQRFDFGSIGTGDITARLQQIAEAEGCQAEPAALELIARRAGGSMRDSQSLLDQFLAFASDRITPDEVHRLLGTANEDVLTELVNAVIAGRHDVVLQLLDRTLADGVQLSELTDQLLDYLRDLMVIASGADQVPLLAVSSDDRPVLAEQAGRWGLRTVLAALQIVSETKTRMFRASDARTLVELALVRLSLLDEIMPIGQLIDQLSGSGDAVPATPSTGTAPRRPTAASIDAVPPAGAKSAPAASDPPAKKKPEAIEPAAERVDDASPASEVTPFEAGSIDALWSQLTADISDMLRDHVQAVSRVAISGPNQLDAEFPASYDFSKQYCERPEMLARLERRLAQLTGQPVRLRFRLNREQAVSGPENGSSRPNSSDRKPKEPDDDDFLEQAKSIFSGNVVLVENIPFSADGKE